MLPENATGQAEGLSYLAGSLTFDMP